MRLIDADALKDICNRKLEDAINFLFATECKEQRLYREAYLEAICNLLIESDNAEVPIIDPVKRGKWLNTSTDIPKLLMNVCSECGFQYPSAIRPRFNYCPNCGAKMDGGEDDEPV